MTDSPQIPGDPNVQRVALAVTELGKGMKTVSFYPSDHPALIQGISKVITLFEDLPLPEKGLEIAVTKNALLYHDVPLAGPAASKSISDLNRELYLRRAAKIIFLPNLETEEVITFLKVITRDVDQVLDAGGLDQALMAEHVSHIWANRVDYDRLTELLKEEELEELEPEALSEDAILEVEPMSHPTVVAEPETVTVDALLARIERETDPSAYREHIVEFSRFLLTERPERKVEYSTLAISIFVRHIESPPGGNREIPGLASLGIKELGTDELVGHYIGLLKRRGMRGRRDTETVLVALEDRSVRPLLQVLAEEEDLLVRKTIVDIIVRIGRTAVPAILENLSDSRWYMVRNMITILGSLGMPDLAPHIVATLSHPDLRVKKEAIKALSKTPHPSAVETLCELCFFPEETVALTATAALASKKDTDAVVTLFRRVATRKILYPDYRLAHEAIDSLRAIGTEDAVTALEEILSLGATWQTEKFRAMKFHALRSISKIGGERSREALQKALQSSEKFLRWEAERILKKFPQ